MCFIKTNMEQPNKAVEVTLLAIKDCAPYKKYVFNLVQTHEILICTRCPNWNCEDLRVGQHGYLEYKFVRAGQDTYYNRVSGYFDSYQYTANYFADFVPITHVLNNGFVVSDGIFKVQ